MKRRLLLDKDATGRELIVTCIIVGGIMCLIGIAATMYFALQVLT